LQSFPADFYSKLAGDAFLEDIVLRIDGRTIPQADNGFFKRCESCDGCDCFVGDGEVAEGYIRQITFPGKFFIEQMDYRFRCFVAKAHPIRTPFIELLRLDSACGVCRVADADDFSVKSGIHAILNAGKSGELVFSPSAPIKGVRVILFERFYRRMIPKRFPGAALDVGAPAQFHDAPPVNPAAQLVFSQIQQSMESGIVSEIYYESKVLELLFFTILQCPVSGAARGKPRVLSCEDMIAVNVAKSIIDARLRDSPKIAELSSLTGTSAAKLQSDFQTAFGCTLHGYVQNVRMKTALHKIENTDEPIYNIAAGVGCKNPSRFSELFRQTFGVTPSEYRTARLRVSPPDREREHG
jgi:AraC-like DNA-binding protein